MMINSKKTSSGNFKGNGQSTPIGDFMVGWTLGKYNLLRQGLRDQSSRDCLWWRNKFASRSSSPSVNVNFNRFSDNLQYSSKRWYYNDDGALKIKLWRMLV
jgi:hypothetical protein